MENTENKNVVIEEKDVEVNEVAKIEKKPNFVVRTIKKALDHKGYVIAGGVGIALGWVAKSIFGHGGDDSEYETTDYEVSDVGTDEGPTED